MVASRLLDRLVPRPETIEALQALPVEQIFAAHPDLSDEPLAGVAALPWQPVIDGAVLQQMPRDAVAAGSAAGVHLMTGTNQHEMTLFQILDAELANLDDDGIVKRLSHAIADPGHVLAEYRAVKPDATVRDLWLDISTDGVFRLPAIRLAQAQAGHGPTWMYRFMWETPVFGGMLKSTHALEIPFVFDTLDRGGVERLTGDGPERAAISAEMHEAWIRFARTGDPGWPAYAAPQRATMQFDAPGSDLAGLFDDPDSRLRLAWEAASA
jgi:para-nitrobenzyl esterase